MEKAILQITADVRDAVNALDFGALETISAKINDLKVRYLGKSGELTAVLRGMKDVPNEKKPLMGKLVNDARVEIEGLLNAAEKRADEALLKRRLETEKIDVTAPSAGFEKGALHPLTITRNMLTDFFVSMGFSVAEGPEIETDYYNFQALNVPADHPARDAQDTFYITDNLLLRTQTSAAQIRTMEKAKPPIKMISPGRVFRADEVDATHSPVFHQIEGLVVDKGITLCDLKGMLDALAKHLFGNGVKTRLRPSFFPFTEPSVELDASCVQCGGKGCKACKGAGWIELLGAGMVNRRVLRVCGIDPDVYTGFAFGMGIDRTANLLFGITDMRLLFENDVRFLRNFR